MVLLRPEREVAFQRSGRVLMKARMQVFQLKEMASAVSDSIRVRIGAAGGWRAAAVRRKIRCPFPSKAASTMRFALVVANGA